MAKRPVVAGFDGSDAGEDALSLATNFARALDVPLVVAVVHPAGGPPGMGRVDAEWVTALRAEADHVAERARKLLDGRAPAQFRLVGSSSARPAASSSWPRRRARPPSSWARAGVARFGGPPRAAPPSASCTAPASP